MNTFGALGYLAVGSLYALLTVLLLTTWRGQRIGIYLILACILSAAWGFLLAAQTAYGAFSSLVIAFVEVLRPVAWVLFLVRLAAQAGISRTLRGFSIFACAATILSIGVLGVGGAQRL